MRGAASMTKGRVLEENLSLKSIDWNVVKRVLDRTKPYARQRNIIFALTVARSMQKPAMAWALAAIINGPISRGDLHGTLWGSFGFAVLAASTSVVFHFRQRLSLTLGELVVHDLRNSVFEHLQKMPLGYYHRTKLGRILSRMITDIEAVRRGVQSVFFFSLLLFGQMVGSVALMIYYNWILFCILLAIAPFVWMTNSYFHPRLSRLSRQVAESSSRVTGNLAEAVRGIRVIQGFNREARSEAIYSGLVDRLKDGNISLASESATYIPMLDFSSQLFYAGLVIVGGYCVLHGVGGMTVKSLIAFSFFPNLFFQSLQQLGNLYTQSITSMAGAERVFRLLDQKPDWTDAENARPLPDPRLKVTAAKRRKVPAAQVEFRRVNFGYNPERLVLQNISFLAKPGQTVALVGHTGSGKTSIINLISKFYLANSGDIFIDGHEIKRLTSTSIRKQIGLVLQTNFLFTGTVLENIRLAKPKATDQEVYEATKSLGCFDILNNLPSGFQTQVGEGGTSLSLGQRQLVCFSRALLADPRILILDEATSSVDTITEARLQKALSTLLEGRTSFVVAHRLSTISQADQILVLSNGEIVERGTHQTLLSRAGKYRSLYEEFAMVE